ncbi:MAG: hypothetical protein GY842_20395, partial [bacterium]|nr:hypothetical protein [bacterium]
DDETSPNAQSSVTQLEVVTENDITAPDFNPGYPEISNVLGKNNLSLTAQLNEIGTTYYVLLADGAAAPTVAEVLAGTGSAGAGVEASGVMTGGEEFLPICYANETCGAWITGLTSETAYDAYLVAEDDESSPNTQSGVTKLEVVTETDITAPDFAPDYPKAENVSGNALDLAVHLNEIGNVYYVLLADGAAAPTPADVKAGTGSAGAGVEASGVIAVGAAYTVYSASVSDLTLETAYDIYLVAEDD